MSWPIEQYAMIGDGRSAALVHTSGAIDWLCWPDFDSRAVFASLLGAACNGFWRIGPCGKYQSRRRYVKNTMVLETEFATPTGRARLTDWMSLERGNRVVFRRIEGLEGQVRLSSRLAARFDYGSISPWIMAQPANRFHILAGPDSVSFSSTLKHEVEGLDVARDFDIKAGERYDFSLTWGGIKSHHHEATPDIDEDYERTVKFWTQWCERCTYHGVNREPVLRSLLTLKSLIHVATGGIVAAPTTSLPECLGSNRNWDYRYCWIRDSTFTLTALLRCGYTEEAKNWRRWLLRTVAGAPEQLNPMYGLSGERRLPEIELPWLEGYANSRPVRTGNAAYQQRQTDIVGELMSTLHLSAREGLAVDASSWKLQQGLVDLVERTWRDPDEGIWEIRSQPQQFTHSKVMAWVAVDRAIRSAELLNLPGPIDRWKKLREQIHRETCEHGFNAEIGSFTQTLGGSEVDASLLLMTHVGFLPPHDPRMRGTVRRIEAELFSGGFVRRYKTENTSDGVGGGEGVFLPCSFWLVDNYVAMGELERAQNLFARLLRIPNDVGLISEEYDPTNKRLLGNFPQALTHISLVNSAVRIDRALKSAGSSRRSAAGAKMFPAGEGLHP